jgi:hypothetical protein
MNVRRLSKAARGFLVCPLPEVFDMDASSVSALQPSRNIPFAGRLGTLLLTIFPVIRSNGFQLWRVKPKIA